MIRELIAAALGTEAFALLFCVPRKYYLHCGIVGSAGWLVYSLTELWGATATEATFFATVLVITLSRFFAVREPCPGTIFVICGIFPLVPGAGIYWTAYYLVTNQISDFQASGFSAVKVMVAIVLGIIIVFEIPHKFFHRNGIV